MLSTLLTTKLYFSPARQAFVPRPGLVTRLQKGLQEPLTLISAPAGSGKTSLLSEWRAGLGYAYPADIISSFLGNHVYVVDYLGEEVLNCQSNAACDFLLRTSILERLNGPLCDALTNRSDG